MRPADLRRTTLRVRAPFYDRGNGCDRRVLPPRATCWGRLRSEPMASIRHWLRDCSLCPHCRHWSRGADWRERRKRVRSDTRRPLRWREERVVAAASDALWATTDWVRSWSDANRRLRACSPLDCGGDRRICPSLASPRPLPSGGPTLSADPGSSPGIEQLTSNDGRASRRRQRQGNIFSGQRIRNAAVYLAADVQIGVKSTTRRRLNSRPKGGRGDVGLAARP